METSREKYGVGHQKALTRETESRTVLKVLRLECRSDDTFLDSVMQARLCVRLRSLRLLRGELTVELALCKAPELLLRGFLERYGKAYLYLVH
jgi:hypothetical protein